MEKNTTAMIIASQNQDYVDEGLAEYQDQIHKLQSKSFVTMNGKRVCINERRCLYFYKRVRLRVRLFAAFPTVQCYHKM